MPKGEESRSVEDVGRSVEDVGKVVVLSGSFPPMKCGVGDSAHALAQHLAKMGVKIEAVTDVEADAVDPGEGPVPVHAGPVHAVPVHAVPVHAVPVHAVPVHAVPVHAVPVHAVIDNWSVWKIKKLARAIESLEPDILHIHYPTKAYGKGLAVPFLPMLIRSRRKRFKIVVTLHEFRLSHPMRRLASFVLVDGAHAVCMPCSLEFEALRRRHISVEENINAAIPVGPIGPSADDFPPEAREEIRRRVRAEWGVSDERVVLLHYGTPTPFKGLEVLFKALRHLKNEGETPLLVIVGDHHPEKNDFHRLLHGQPGGLGIKDQVRWLGRVDEDGLVGAFVSADIGVFPFVDGFSFRRSSLIGTLMWDLPITTTEPTGELEGIGGQEKVRFCARGDPRALATSLLPLLANPKVLDRLRAVPNPLKDYFRWEGIARRYLEIYRQVRELQ